MSLPIIALLAAMPATSCDMNGSQQSMNACAERRFQAADAELNAVWARTVAVMREHDRHVDRRYDSRPGYLDTLRAAQRAWIIFRDQHCTGASFEVRGGSLEPMLYSLCREELTRARTQQLLALTDVEN